MSLAAMADMARRENEAARRTWDVAANETFAGTYHKNITERVVPYIGSGYSLAFVGRALGCSAQAVNAALNKLGAKL